MKNCKFGDFLEKINPCCNGYRILYAEKGKQVDKFFVEWKGLFAYSDYYLQGISAYEQEAYGACLSFALSKELF